MLLAALGLATTGCVDRWLLIRSDPPTRVDALGNVHTARVFLDGADLGAAPARVPFEHYGTHEVVVRLADHDSTTQQIEVATPWYQWFPIDLIAEFLWPWTIHDEHVYTIALSRLDPQAIADRIEAVTAAQPHTEPGAAPGDPETREAPR